MSHQPLRKFRGSNDHCTEFCCYLLKMLYEKKDIRNNKTDIKKKLMQPILFSYSQSQAWINAE